MGPLGMAGLGAIVSILTLGSCGREAPSGRQLLEVFGPGFIFVGTEEAPRADLPAGVYPPEPLRHGNDEQPLPDRIEVGKIYVFHNTGPVDVERLALEALPKELERLGARITEQLDLESRFFGSVHFGIHSEFNGLKMSIQTPHVHEIFEDPQLWFLQDFELIVYDQ